MPTFPPVQLILRAASVGSQATAAVADAVRADALGAAKGRFGVDALRRDGTLAASPSESSGTLPDSSTTRDGASAPSAATVAPVIASDLPTLEGVTTVLLDEADPDNILLEQLRLADSGGAVPHSNAAPSHTAATATSAVPSTAAAPLSVAAGTPDLRPREERYAAGDVIAQLARTAAVPPTPTEAAAISAAMVTDAPLSALDQCVVLALCLDVRNSNPADGLTAEEMRT